MKEVKDGTEPQMPDDPDLPPPMVRKKGDNGREMPVLKPKAVPTTKEPADSRVVQIAGSAEFDRVLARSNVALVEFYAPWCADCCV